MIYIEREEKKRKKKTKDKKGIKGKKKKTKSSNFEPEVLEPVVGSCLNMIITDHPNRL